jgi:hypothetical protein
MRKTSLLIFTVLLSVSILFSSCGVMFGGSKYQGRIVAKDHPNAQIYVDGQKLGNGDVTSLFKRKQDLKVEVKEEGCESKVQVFQNKFRTGNFILSLLSFGLVGIAVDLGTGASYKPDHKGNSNIKKLSDKNYEFTVDYPECKK